MPDELAHDSRNKINNILSKIEKVTGVAFTRPNPNTWIVDLESGPIHIMSNGPWVTVASKVMNDVQGKNEGKFYRELLERNGRLNGLKISIERNNVTFNSEHPSSEVTPKTIVNDLILHHNGHKTHFEQMVKRADNLGLKWRRSASTPKLGPPKK